MVKSYLTYASSPVLEGYEKGGEGWLKEFNAAVADHLKASKKAFKEIDVSANLKRS